MSYDVNYLENLENLENIEFKKTNNNISLVNYRGKKIKFCLENIYIPFGLEKYKFNMKFKYFLKINLSQELYEIFSNFEDYVCKKVFKLYGKNYKIKSQLEKRNTHNLLILKIKEFRNKLLSKIIDKEGCNISIFEITSKLYANIIISPNIYINNNEIIIKWTIETINITR